MRECGRRAGEENVGLANPFGEQIGGVLVADKGINDGRIADDHIAHFGGQAKHHGFVQANPDKAAVS